MYFIKGILEQNRGNKDQSVQAFSSAIRVKPDLKWDSFYSPDAKPYFDLAKDQFVQLKSIELEIIPKSAGSSLWINGAPLLNVDSPEILEGTNIIQIVGMDTQTYEITIPSNTDKVRIIAPSTLPISALSWVDDEVKKAELAIVLDSVVEEDSVFLHEQGRVWEPNLDTNHGQN